MALEIDLQFVIDVTRQAGDLALEMHLNALHEFKLDQTYVTNVDREVELFLEKELGKRYPEFTFLGEEYGLRGDPDAPTWAVDPIDGTTNFVLNSPFWCVSVGLVYQNQPVLGVIYIPRVQELYCAKVGEGAFCNGIPINARDVDKPHSEDPLCMTSRASKYYNIRPWNGVFRSLGSIAAEICYVARGTMCGTVGHVKTLHDVAAAFCIAKEAGCDWTYMNGEPIDLWEIFNNGGGKTYFVVAPPKTRQWLMTNLHKTKD